MDASARSPVPASLIRLLVRCPYNSPQIELGEAMLTNSRDIKRRLESDGWLLIRVTGSHHVFKHPTSRQTIVLPHPKKNLGVGLVRTIYKQAQWERD